MLDSEVIIYAAEFMPENDSDMSGGAIDPTVRLHFTDLAADDDLEVFSSSSADTTQTFTGTGRSATNSLEVSQSVSLNGTNAVILTTAGIMKQVQKGLLNAECVGTVTVRRSPGGITVATIPPGELGFRRVFINAKSIIGESKTFCEKGFLKNNNSSDTMSGVVISQNADPTGNMDFAVEAAQGGSTAIYNRLASPDLTFNSSAKTIPDDDLEPGACVGIWFKMSLAPSEIANDSTYTLAIAIDG